MKIRWRLVGLGAALAVAVAVVAHTPAPTALSPCRARGDLPDPVCTPGVPDKRVIQSNIATTICVPGWSKKIRPPVSYTQPIKVRDIAAYGAYAGTDPAGYELDHLIPISWGGDPRDPANLWPESPGSPNPKDRLELAGLAMICSKKISLDDARNGIAHDWRALAARLHVHV